MQGARPAGSLRPTPGSAPPRPPAPVPWRGRPPGLQEGGARLHARRSRVLPPPRRRLHGCPAAAAAPSALRPGQSRREGSAGGGRECRAGAGRGGPAGEHPAPRRGREPGTQGRGWQRGLEGGRAGPGGTQGAGKAGRPPTGRTGRRDPGVSLEGRGPWRAARVALRGRDLRGSPVLRGREALPGRAEACILAWSWVGTRGKANAGVWRNRNKCRESGRCWRKRNGPDRGRGPCL